MSQLTIQIPELCRLYHFEIDWYQVSRFLPSNETIQTFVLDGIGTVKTSLETLKHVYNALLVCKYIKQHNLNPTFFEYSESGGRFTYIFFEIMKKNMLPIKLYYIDNQQSTINYINTSMNDFDLLKIRYGLCDKSDVCMLSYHNSNTNYKHHVPLQK